jgi:hypothetical protein
MANHLNRFARYREQAEAAAVMKEYDFGFAGTISDPS